MPAAGLRVLEPGWSLVRFCRLESRYRNPGRRSWQIQWAIDQEDHWLGRGGAGDYTIAWSPDSHRLVAVNGGGQLVMWDLRIPQWPKRYGRSKPIPRSSALSRGPRMGVASRRVVKIAPRRFGMPRRAVSSSRSMVTFKWYGLATEPRWSSAATADNVSLRIWDATEAYEAADLGRNKLKVNTSGPHS